MIRPENELPTASASQPGRKRFLLEVAVASVEDAQAAEAGGADRLELNAAQSLGGLTPSLGTLIEVRQATSLPLCVMLRHDAAHSVTGQQNIVCFSVTWIYSSAMAPMASCSALSTKTRVSIAFAVARSSVKPA